MRALQAHPAESSSKSFGKYRTEVSETGAPSSELSAAIAISEDALDECTNEVDWECVFRSGVRGITEKIAGPRC